MNDLSAAGLDAGTASSQDDQATIFEEFGGEPIEIWSVRQSAHADFGDQRLNARLAKVLDALARKPFDSFPQAHNNWGQAKATYRFIENNKTSYEKIILAVGAATAERCAGLPMIYAVQDTTSLNYSNLRNSSTGLGGLNGPGNTLGLHMHSTIALSPEGVPLGVLHAKIWARPKKRKRKSKSKPKRPPFEKRESYKWVDGLKASSQALEEQLSAERRPKVVYVMDREGDVHEVLQEISERGDDAIIRSMNDRNIDGEIGKAHQAVRAAPLLGEHVLDIPAKPGRAKRKAILQVRALCATITPSTKGARHRKPSEWTLVEVWEHNPPDGTEPIHWLLWTPRKVETLAEAIEVLRGYALRWRVEEYHLVLKSGCRIEDLRLTIAERLAKAIALYSPVAVSIVALRDLGRREPEAPCTLVLSDDQWRVLWRHFKKEEPAPKQKPMTIRQAVLWIGRLGGHLGRKHDGMPGVRTLWRGWRDLTLLVLGYQAARHR